jgi:hypothetical protein
MSELFFSTIKRLTPILRQGDLDACEREVVSEMQKLPASPFHIAIDLSIANDPVEAADHFDRFFELESKRFQIGAAYTEMNGFDINPNSWFCNVFAYPADGGNEEWGWLSDWQSERFEDYQIIGLERLQDAYRSEAFRERENRSARYMSNSMVVVMFQRFMRRAASHMELLRFPLYTTAHDFDFIDSFDPRPESERTPVRRLSAEEQTNELIATLNDGDARTRFRAVTKLSTIGSAAKKSVPALIELLTDAAPATRQAAAIALTKIAPASDAVVSALVARLELEPLPATRREIARALGRITAPTKAATAALAKALFEDPELRRCAVISLKLLGVKAKDAAPSLQRLMEFETDEDIRTQVAVALKRMLE